MVEREQNVAPITISEMSAATALTPHTLRYYERIGLMIPVQRSSSGHREYSSGAIDWVILLQHLRDTGMSIAQMQAFAELVRLGPESVPERLALLRHHRDGIREQIATLNGTLAILDAKIAVYEAGNAATPQTMSLEKGAK